MAPAVLSQWALELQRKPLHRQIDEVVNGAGDDNDDGDSDDDGEVTVVLKSVRAMGVEISVAIARCPEHKSLESPRLHGLDMLQHNILDLGQHKSLVVIRHGDPLRKIGRIS
jgi:hypothetical protein